MRTRAVVWLVRDSCRVVDNPPLSRAAERAREMSAIVIPLACLEPRRWQNQQFGLPRVGDHWCRFRTESLLALGEALATQGSALWVAADSPDRALDRVAGQFQILEVHTDVPLSTEERLENARIEAEGYGVHVTETDELFTEAQLPFELDALPKTFTQFRKVIEKPPALRPHAPLPTPILPPIQAAPWPDPPEWIEAVEACVRSTELRIKGGTPAGQAHWDAYLASGALSAYKATRNALDGEHPWSQLSPWLAHGCLSVRHVWYDTLAYEDRFGANESTYWLRFELLWREYFRWYARASDWTLFRKEGPAGRVVSGDRHPTRWRAWKEGMTGCDIVDAAMRELVATGWMSNRARQLVASALIYESNLDWRLGASWFEANLIDYDVASNWGNWAYIAGVGADPRGGRIFNLAQQASRHDPDGRYRARWLA